MRIWYVSILVMSLVLSNGCYTGRQKHVYLQQGKITLSLLDVFPYEIVLLNGQWGFHHQKFLVPPFEEEDPSFFIEIGKSWQGIEFQNQILPREGYGTYRAIIQLDPSLIDTEFTLFVPAVSSASHIYINNKWMGGRGNPAEHQSDSKPKVKNAYYNFKLTQPTLEILIHASNFELNFGGLRGIPKLGTREIMDIDKTLRISLDIFLAGAMLIVSLFAFGLFLANKTDRSPFYFALFVICICIRTLFTSAQFIEEIDIDFPWIVAERILGGTNFLALGLFVTFLNRLFPRKKIIYITRMFQFASIFFLGTLILPISSISKVYIYFQYTCTLVFFYTLTISSFSVYKREENATLILIAVLILGITILVEIVRYQLNLIPITLIPFGLIGFTFIQSFILSNRLKNAMTKSENLANDLSKSNQSLLTLTENLEDKVVQRTTELKKSLSRIEYDLILAKKIQEKILPSRKYARGRIQIEVDYSPRDMVGGDIFDIFDFNERFTRILLADATGHGVQAALYTMAIKGEYETIKYAAISPGNLLSDLNRLIQIKFQSLHILFSAIVIDIDVHLNTITYSSAGHNDQWILRLSGKVDILKRTGPLIGLYRDFDFHNEKNSLNANDLIVLFTDGLTEQPDELKNMFGEDNLKQVLLSNRKVPLNEVLNSVKETLSVYCKVEEQVDDRSLILIRADSAD